MFKCLRGQAEFSFLIPRGNSHYITSDQTRSHTSSREQGEISERYTMSSFCKVQGIFIKSSKDMVIFLKIYLVYGISSLIIIQCGIFQGTFCSSNYPIIYQITPLGTVEFQLKTSSFFPEDLASVLCLLISVQKSMHVTK